MEEALEKAREGEALAKKDHEEMRLARLGTAGSIVFGMRKRMLLRGAVRQWGLWVQRREASERAGAERGTAAE